MIYDEDVASVLCSALLAECALSTLSLFSSSRLSIVFETEANDEKIQIGPMLGLRATAEERSSLNFEQRRVVGFACAVNATEVYHFSVKSREDAAVKLVEKLFEGRHTILLLNCIMQLKLIMAALGVFPRGDLVKFEVNISHTHVSVVSAYASARFSTVGDDTVNTADVCSRYVAGRVHRALACRLVGVGAFLR